MASANAGHLRLIVIQPVDDLSVSLSSIYFSVNSRFCHLTHGSMLFGLIPSYVLYAAPSFIGVVGRAGLFLSCDIVPCLLYPIACTVSMSPFRAFILAVQYDMCIVKIFINIFLTWTTLAQRALSCVEFRGSIFR